MQIGGLVQVAASHLGSYLELIGQAAAEYRAFVLRRAWLASGAIIMASATLMTTWTTGLALLWDSQWRLTYCVASALLYLAVTVTLGALAVRRSTAGPYSRSLRDEAAQDLALLQEWRRSA